MFLGVDNTSSSEKWRLKLRDTLFLIKENPYIGWILNIGFYMNLFIILIVYGLQRKKYATVGAFSLIILNIGINFIGPKVYLRYSIIDWFYEKREGKKITTIITKKTKGKEEQG